MVKLSEAQRQSVHEAHRHERISFRQLAARFSVTPRIAKHWALEGYKKRPRWADSRRSGRPRKLSVSQRKKVKALASRGKSCRQIAAENDNLGVCFSTVHRTLRGGRKPLCWGRKRRAQQLRPANIPKRLQWCAANIQPSQQPEVFLDAKGCYMRRGQATDVEFCWQDPTKEDAPAAEGKGAMVQFYGAVARGHKSKLHFVPPTPGTKPKSRGLTAVHFAQAFKAMHKEMKAWYGSEPFTIIMDRAKPHTAKSTRLAMTKMGATQVDASFPPQSWDLNMIELVWGILAQKLKGRRPRSVRGYKRVAQQAWASVSQAAVDATVAKLQERKLACIASGGQWPSKKH